MEAEVETTRYPLSWPVGWKRTEGAYRRKAKFHRSNRPLTMVEARTRIRRELRLLGASNVVLSTNVELRHDGEPYSNRREPDDVGAAVYFSLRGQARSFACDVWTRVADNIAAMEKHINAQRAIGRYGVGTIDQAFAGYAPRLQAATFEWWIVLGVPRGASALTVEDAYLSRMRLMHPDVEGGSDYEASRLNEARDAAHAEIAAR